MVFFRLDRTTRVALVGAAMAAAPACAATSQPEEDDGHADVHEADIDAPLDEVGPEDADGDAGADTPPDELGTEDADRDTDADAPLDELGAEDATLDEVGAEDADTLPSCDDLAGFYINTTTRDRTTEYAVASLGLYTGGVPLGSPCLLPSCVEVIPTSGAVSDISLLDGTDASFRYTNPDLAWGEYDDLVLRWKVRCRNAAGAEEMRQVEGTAVACRDSSFNLAVGGSMWDCEGIVDPPPPPMVRVLPPAGRAPGAPFLLRTAPQPDGAWHITAVGPLGRDVRYRWIAAGGTLRMLSDVDAIFRPLPHAGTQLVQVAAFAPEGVSIQVFRRHPG